MLPPCAHVRRRKERAAKQSAEKFDSIKDEIAAKTRELAGALGPPSPP